MIRGAIGGIWLLWWEQAVGAPVQSWKQVCRKAQERREKFERVFRPLERRKALKGESQECWELRETSQDEGADTIERVAKP
jgi:hypothetical protein